MKILIMMPSFMGYDESLLKELRKYYEVDFVDNEAVGRKINKDIENSVFLRIIRKLLKKRTLKELFLESLIRKHENILTAVTIHDYDVVICINGHFVSNRFYKKIRNNNPNAQMILYFWDDLNNILKLKHMRYFKNIYSYNIDDCLKYNMKYLPMYVQNDEYNCNPIKKEYDIAIIGTAHPNRLKIAEEIYTKYKEKFNIFVYMYHPTSKIGFFGHNKPLSYNEYMNVLLKSRAVVDLPSKEQKGPTTRFFDAVLTKTKVITVNENITKYPIYSDNILIIDEKELNISEVFIEGEYIDTDHKVYNPNKWINSIVMH